MVEWKNLLPLVLLVLGVFTLFITFRNKITGDIKKRGEKWDDFLQDEVDALFIRKKEIPSHLFLKPDLEKIVSVEDGECLDLYHKVRYFSALKMINLKGMTNLELKRKYGMSHLENLINYEKNYLSFIDILVKYGTILYEKDFIEKAKSILELAITYECDSSKGYILLAEIYAKEQNLLALKELIILAQKNMQGSHYLNKVLDRINALKKEIHE